MRIISIVAALVGVMFGQTTTQPYVGTWTAATTGNIFVRVELTIANGALGGRIGLGDIQVNADGDVKTAGAIRQMLPLFDVVLRGSTLSFASKDGGDTDHFEMELVDNQNARLRVLLSDDDIRQAATVGVPPPKPIPLTKQPR